MAEHVAFESLFAAPLRNGVSYAAKTRGSGTPMINMREIFELRLFSSYIINVSGRGVRTLAEADFRRNQLVEFEHHLWCY